MRTSLLLLAVSLAGAIAGAWLVGMWAVGLVVMTYSVTLGGYALLREVPEPTVERPDAGTVEDVLDRARRAAG